MAGFRNIFIGVILIIFTTFCLVGFTTLFLNQTNPNADALSSQYGLNASYNTLSNSLSGVSDLANKTKGIGDSSVAESTNFVFLIFQGAIEIPKLIATFIYTGVVTFGTLISTTLLGKGLGGSQAVVLGISLLISGIIITAVLLFVKLVRTGESER